MKLVSDGCESNGASPRNADCRSVNAPQAQLIGDSAVMQDVFRVIGRLSKSSVSVLITGETGTGKERVARALHQHIVRDQHTRLSH